ncbi:hypothetical protein ACFPER_01290 [Agromyces aurantiacus]|uniref:Uncharacterized protein n=1 Tax=Agromyces aurantiacus TaxID=165814 RepID=A0ABV9R1R9_9MICO|nr:hypothetical protein [Agromyces aurantiacus]MBM7505720.1 hypothetical protein [Agromyces aurantiacus]
MRLDIDLDERFWAHLPAAFPAPGFADRVAWERGIVERYRSVRPDADEDERVAVDAIAAGAVDSLVPAAVFGLLFWPAPRPDAVLVHVEIAPPLRSGDDPVRELVGGIPLAIPPSVDPIEAPGVGGGVISAFVLPSAPGEPPVAGVGCLLSGPRGSVRLTSSPTTTTMVGLLHAPLRAAAETLRFAE